MRSAAEFPIAAASAVVRPHGLSPANPGPEAVPQLLTFRSVAVHFPLRLAESRMLAPSVRHMAFERADGAPFAFVPGQFVQIHFNYADGKPTKRSYSVATVGNGDGSPVQRVEMAVSYVDGGAATELLGNLKHGESVDGSGPYGRFCLMDPDANRR